MTVKISNFGDDLLSRPAGKEAFLMARSYVFKDVKTGEEITLDFAEVKVMTPSWLDEFITGIQRDCGATVKYENTENPSVAASLRTVLAA
jgi:hypothetical protein